MFLRIMNCVTMKLIRLQVRKDQLVTWVFLIFFSRKFCASINPYKYVLLGHSISSSAIPCCSRQISVIEVKDKKKVKIPGCSQLTVNNQYVEEDSHYSPRSPLLKPKYRKVLVDFRIV